MANDCHLPFIVQNCSLYLGVLGCFISQENPQTPDIYAQKGDREVLQLYLNKGRRFIGAHAHGVCSLEVSESAASFYPKLPLTLLSPLVEVLGRYNCPCLPYVPHLNLLFYPKVQKLRFMQTLVCFRSQAVWAL